MEVTLDGKEMRDMHDAIAADDAPRSPSRRSALARAGITVLCLVAWTLSYLAFAAREEGQVAAGIVVLAFLTWLALLVLWGCSRQVNERSAK